MTDLGVIEELGLVLGPGMTAVTGETGAGKTLVVDAISLLVGARAEGVRVRPGAAEATVEGRFDHDGDEVVLRRVVPPEERSRAYVDGRLATARELGERGTALVDLHGQHGHQSLLSTAAQRRALDRYAGVDLAPLVAARARLAEVDAGLAALGGDERARAREVDLVRYQVDELVLAGLADPGEDDALAITEATLGDALAHREAAAVAADALGSESGAGDGAARALAAVRGRAPFADLEGRVGAVAAEVSDLASEVRHRGEGIDDDPARLAEVQARRQLLGELRRKYGDTLAEVISYRDEAADRLAELTSHDARAAELAAERERAVAEVAAAEDDVGRARRAAAPALGRAVEERLRELALPKARVAVEVGDDPGDDVTFTLAANPGAPLLPLAKVASGGELARAMLALRLVLTEAPGTLVFDEVDAGVGGSAALAVGRSLAGLGAGHQVLVVTHLPQVAAFADAQVSITKADARGATSTRAKVLDDDERVVELSRMLSGQPHSDTARGHARELLATAAQERGR